MLENSAGQDGLPVQNNKPKISPDEVADWLGGHLDAPAPDVQPLAGGFWSAAFAYEHQGQEFVVRFNESSAGFEIDQAAHAFSVSGLPIPEVFEIGNAIGLSFAISRRHHGLFLESVPPEAAPGMAQALADLFKQFRRVPADSQVEWYDPTSHRSWHDYLLRSISDEAGGLQDGWHQALHSHPNLKDLYQASRKRILELLPLCPERRDLVHGDLLHQNVLVSAQMDQVQAVFSWKCSVFGDFLYDIAWCTHWAPWHPGIAAVDVFEMTLAADDLDRKARDHFAERHHCYELQIAASHIGWYLWTRDEENLDLLTRGLRERLDRGPQAMN